MSITLTAAQNNINFAENSQNTALARLYGEPVFILPHDLYIPPDALEVFLEAFEGPLDLLLYLIRKQNFNILDIPMVNLTGQYLAYVEEIRHRNLELAAEYLLMAAVLIEIKSRMLLPLPKSQEDTAEAQDPRAELVRRLLEYEKIKQGAQQLGQMPHCERDFFIAHASVEYDGAPRFAQVCAHDLQQAWLAMMHRATLVQHHQITREALSVREYMTLLLKALQGRRFLPFEALFQPEKGAAVLVVTFTALLELAKERLIEITQAQAFAPIYVRLAIIY